MTLTEEELRACPLKACVLSSLVFIAPNNTHRERTPSMSIEILHFEFVGMVADTNRGGVFQNSNSVVYGLGYYLSQVHVRQVSLDAVPHQGTSRWT